MTKEEKFYKALQDVFIGAQIEGQGGFINLMQIKSNYYRKIEDILKKDIEAALKSYPSFRDELFDKLYSFFSRYFTESGSIYFNSTPFHNNIYEKVYTDEKDVILFWKTQMLYYVKTDRIFRSLPVEFDGFKFYFDASKIENKKANEKRSLIFELNKILEDGTIVFDVQYSEKGKKTKQDDILKAIKRKGITITEEQLERAFRVFEKQSEVDFFINKNAKAFLQEQFKLWSYQYFWEGAKEWSTDRVNQLQILKDIAFKIIDFISQFEDELVKIWNKPKFVKNSNYVITLDRIKDISLIEHILEHENINEQIREWQELGIVDENFKLDDVFTIDLTGKHLSKKYQHLPIDTKYFKDLELEILSQFEDLDKALDGWLIKSENYQALNTILPKFKEKVQTIYIDPPFNLDSSDQFLYRTNYKDANWATLLENRLKLAKDWLNERGSIFVRCDYNGNWIVRPIMDDVFGRENFRNEIIIKRGASKAGLFTQFEGINSMAVSYDNFYWYSKNESLRFRPFLKEAMEEQKIKGKWTGFDKGEAYDRPTMRYEILGVSIDKGQWKWRKERAHKAVKNYKKYLDEFADKYTLEEYWEITGRELEFIRKNDNGKIQYWVEPREFVYVDNNWLDITGYSSSTGFQTENSEYPLRRIIETLTNENDLIFDFFLGSGTTTAVAHKLGRKWIGVEMGEHFYSVVLPRMKKVLAYDKSGISKEKDVKEKYNENNAGGFFKYYELEQYEEALANAVYENHDIVIMGNKSPYEQYVFLKDEKMLKTLEIDYENNKVKVDLDKLYSNIDIAETLSNLTGKWIKKSSDSEVEFEDGVKINIKDLDYKLIKPLIWWE
ncbi:MAG: adenine-specific DNA-methyltransferase [Deferribacteres bacterium]|nr:adenine-specific DNA-methyltransferase [Deferribacteres bacterium]